MDKILANIAAFSNSSQQNNVQPPEKTVSQMKPITSAKSIPATKTAVVCFSKERPYQLHQFLLSLEKFAQSSIDSVTVLYLPCAYEEEYSTIFRYHPKVLGIKEQNFYSDFLGLLKSFSSKDIGYVMFYVDDLVFTSPVDFR
jgi:hypothetical protein